MPRSPDAPASGSGTRARRGVTAQRRGPRRRNRDGKNPAPKTCTATSPRPTTGPKAGARSRTRVPKGAERAGRGCLPLPEMVGGGRHGADGKMAPRVRHCRKPPDDPYRECLAEAPHSSEVTPETRREKKPSGSPTSACGQPVRRTPVAHQNGGARDQCRQLMIHCRSAKPPCSTHGEDGRDQPGHWRPYIVIEGRHSARTKQMAPVAVPFRTAGFRKSWLKNGSPRSAARTEKREHTGIWLLLADIRGLWSLLWGLRNQPPMLRPTEMPSSRLLQRTAA